MSSVSFQFDDARKRIAAWSRKLRWHNFANNIYLANTVCLIEKTKQCHHVRSVNSGEKFQMKPHIWEKKCSNVSLKTVDGWTTVLGKSSLSAVPTRFRRTMTNANKKIPKSFIFFFFLNKSTVLSHNEKVFAISTRDALCIQKKKKVEIIFGGNKFWQIKGHLSI